jgi:hypothetical protein
MQKTEQQTNGRLVRQLGSGVHKKHPVHTLIALPLFVGKRPHVIGCPDA